MSGSNVQRGSIADFNADFDANRLSSSGGASSIYASDHARPPHAKPANRYQPRALAAILEDLQSDAGNVEESKVHSDDDVDIQQHVIVGVAAAIQSGDIDAVASPQYDLYQSNIDSMHVNADGVVGPAGNGSLPPSYDDAADLSDCDGDTLSTINTSFSPSKQRYVRDPHNYKLAKRRLDHKLDSQQNKSTHRHAGKLGEWQATYGINNKQREYRALDGHLYKDKEAWDKFEIDQLLRKKRKHGGGHISSSSPGLASNQLGYWGVPDSMAQVYKHTGVTQLFDWQADCLSKFQRFQDEDPRRTRHLLYSAPTSGGKTLIAEMLCLQHVQARRKVLFVQPYKSIIDEKQADLSDKLMESGCVVLGLHSDKRINVSVYDNIDVIVCTYERANMLFNAMVEDNTFHKVGLVVVDEMHMLDNDDRGSNLEMLVTKLLHYNKSQQTRHSLQIVGLTATISNIHELQQWLGEDNTLVYQTQTRPVELSEYVVIDNQCLDRHGTVCTVVTHPLPCHVDYQREQSPVLAELIYDMLVQNKQTLVFANTLARTQSIVKFLLGVSAIMHIDVNQDVLNKRLQLLDAMQQDSECNDVMRQGVMCGIAYHHARLPAAYKTLIEQAYKAGTLSALVATTTLATGVNLPAQRVIFRNELDHMGRLLTVTSYKQMCGRAGRAGLNQIGESVMLCSDSKNRAAVLLLMNSDVPPLKSKLLVDNSPALAQAILEMVSASSLTTLTNLHNYISCSLFAQQCGDEQHVHERVAGAVQQLISRQLLQRDAYDVLTATQLGKATHGATVPAFDSKEMMQELTEIKSHGLCLTSTLHQCYLVCSVSERQHNSITKPLCDNDTVHNILCDILQRDDHEYAQHQATLRLLGVDMALIQRILTEQPYRNFRLNVSSGRGKPHWVKCYRLVCAFFLNRMIEEDDPATLCSKYAGEESQAGDYHALLQNGAARASMLSKFVGTLKWKAQALLLQRLSDRLSHGVKTELVDLMNIPGMTRQQARKLYDSQMRTVRDVVAAGSQRVFDCFMQYIQYIKQDHKLSEAQVQYLKQKREEKIMSEAEHIVRSAKLMRTLDKATANV